MQFGFDSNLSVDLDQENIDDMYSVAYMKKYRHLKTRSSKTQAEKAAKQDTVS